MSAQPASARPGLLASALARAEAWLLEPVEDTAEEREPVPRARAVVTVFGLAEGCGTTVVARALGAQLAARDQQGACAVSSAGRSAALPLGSAAAGRLARTLGSVRDARTQPVGRLCLIECSDLGRLADAARYLAPLVIDAGRTAVGGAPAALADHVLLVASPPVEPALVSVARESLARAGHEPVVVLNRRQERGPLEESADVVLPESRMGAQLALAGREPRGELGRAVSVLADRCEEPRA